MDRSTIIAKLREFEPELKAAVVASIDFSLIPSSLSKLIFRVN